MPSFEIPDGPANVKLQSGAPGAKAPYTGAIVFNVTNKTAAPLAGRLSVQTAGQSKADWFVIAGEKERTFAAGETQTVTVNIAVPSESASGNYSFRLRAVSVIDPDNDHTAGPAAIARVEGAASPNPGTRIWPFILGGIVLLLIIGGVVAWRLLQPPDTDDEPKEGNVVVAAPATVTVPRLVRENIKDAQTLAKDLSVQALKIEPTGAEPGTILDQTPAEGERRNKGDQVKVYYDPGVQVPALFGETVEVAVHKLNAAGLKNEFSTTCRPGRTDRVAGQDPAPSVMAAKNAVIKVTVNVRPSSQTICRLIIRPELMRRAIRERNFSMTLNKSLNP